MFVELKDSQHLSYKRSSVYIPDRDIRSTSICLLSAYYEVVKVLGLETTAVENKQR